MTIDFMYSRIPYQHAYTKAFACIHRDDKFKQYTLWGDLDLILKDADAFIAASPFEKERIIEVLQSVFIRSGDQVVVGKLKHRGGGTIGDHHQGPACGK